MEITRVKEVVEAFIQNTLGKTGYVTAISKSGENWSTAVEVIEEKGYIDDVLGEYEVTLDSRINVASYRRKGLRRRSDFSPKDWQKEGV